MMAEPMAAGRYGIEHRRPDRSARLLETLDDRADALVRAGSWARWSLSTRGRA